MGAGEDPLILSEVGQSFVCPFFFLFAQQVMELEIGEAVKRNLVSLRILGSKMLDP